MIYFTSDLHFFHQNVIGYCDRPFNDVNEMNTALIDNWNSTIDYDPNAIIYILGDVVMGNREDNLPILSKLIGKKKLVPGNHCYCVPLAVSKAKAEYYLPIYEQYLEVLPLESEYEEFLLCHFPYFDIDRHSEKYKKFLPAYREQWLLHGHIHGKSHFSPDRKFCMDIGVDASNYRPLSILEIREKINSL